LPAAKQMTTEKRGPGPTPPPDSLKSDAEPLDVTWDDDTQPGFAPGDSIFDRVTEIPDIPLEVHAKQMMQVPAEDDPISGTFSRNGEATATGLELDLDALSSLPPPPQRPNEDPLPEPDTERAPPPSSGLDSTSPDGDRFSLDFAVPPPPQGKFDGALREIKDRYAMGDYSGALLTAEGILEADPDQPDAIRYANRCRQVLTDMYSARIGQMSQVASVAVPPDQIRWLSLDHRAGFLLSLVDGQSTLDEVLDISGMPRLDALRILFSLIEERVVALAPKNP
jgi:hypothetical protein